MIIENSEALRNWLTPRLGDICNGDPVAVTKYVMALLRRDKEYNELYKFCLEQLDVFFTTSTKPFVDMLFETLRTKSYIINPLSESVPETNRTLPVIKDAIQCFSITTSENKGANEHRKLLHCSKILEKEGVCELSKSSQENYAFLNEKLRNLESQKHLMRKNLESQKHPMEYEPQNICSVADTTYRFNKNITGNTIQRCQDYHGKGYCMRGDFCGLDHGTDPVIVEDVTMMDFDVAPEIVQVPPLPPYSPEQSPPPPPPPPSSPLQSPLRLASPYLPSSPLHMPPLYLPSSIFSVPPPYMPSLPLHTMPKHLPSFPLHVTSSSSTTSSPFPSLSVSLTLPSRVAATQSLPRLPPSDSVSKKLPVHKEITCSDVQMMPSDKKRKVLDYDSSEPEPKKSYFKSRYMSEVSKPKHVSNTLSIKNPVSKFGTGTSNQFLQTLNIRLELHKKKQAFLESQIQHEKDLLNQLSKTKNEKKRAFLKNVIQYVATHITSLEADTKKSSEELIKYLKSYCTPVPNCENKKELLDAELDLYNREYKGEDTTDLLPKLKYLRKKSRDEGFVSSPSLKVVQNQTPKPSHHQTKFFSHKHTSSSKSVNPKILGTSSFHIEDIHEKQSLVLLHEKQRESDIPQSLGQEYKDSSSKEKRDYVVDKENKDSLHLLDFDEEEEEEDMEPRSWRH